MTVIDCHAFVGRGVPWYGPEREVDYTLDALFEHGAEAGIDRYCVMPPRNSTYQEANKLVAGVCEKHSGKLIGFAAHSPQREAGQLARALTSEVNSMGLRGVRSDGPPTRELLDIALQLRVPVMYYPSGQWQQLGHFYHMPAMAYPGLDFIIPHVGQYCSQNWSPHIEAIDLAKRYPQHLPRHVGRGQLQVRGDGGARAPRGEDSVRDVCAGNGSARRKGGVAPSQAPAGPLSENRWAEFRGADCKAS